MRKQEADIVLHLILIWHYHTLRDLFIQQLKICTNGIWRYSMINCYPKNAWTIYLREELTQVVILFSNAGGAPLNNITNAIISILNGQDYKFPAKPLVDQLNKTIEKVSITEAINEFNKLKSDKELYSYNERELNLLGYTYLRANKIEEAIAIFKLNIQEYPKSWNVYDSYAEALMVNGENEVAIGAQPK